MLTCKQASQLVSESLDRPLAWPRRAALRFHLLLCRACATYRRQMLHMRRALHASFLEAEERNACNPGPPPATKVAGLPAAARERIEEVLSESSNH